MPERAPERLRVPSGVVLSQTVFNPAAQRGINSVSARGNRLLVANCSVGADDDNLWYFSIDTSTWALTLLDSMNLIIDPLEIQSFNFGTKWGNTLKGHAGLPVPRKARSGWARPTPRCG